MKWTINWVRTLIASTQPLTLGNLEIGATFNALEPAISPNGMLVFDGMFNGQVIARHTNHALVRYDAWIGGIPTQSEVMLANTLRVEPAEYRSIPEANGLWQ
jgi:hypothetical protein